MIPFITEGLKILDRFELAYDYSDHGDIRIFNPTNGRYVESDTYGVCALLGLLEDVGALKTDKLDALVDLERRVTELEKRMGTVSDGAALEGSTAQPTEATDDDSTPAFDKERLDRLDERARAIGHVIYSWGVGTDHHGVLRYDRHIRNVDPFDKRSQRVFTIRDAYDLKRARDRRCWIFEYNELDALELFIAHDERLYAQYFGDVSE